MVARAWHLELDSQINHERRGHVGNRRPQIVGIGGNAGIAKQSVEIVLVVELSTDRELWRNVVGGACKKLDGAALVPLAIFPLPPVFEIDVRGQAKLVVHKVLLEENLALEFPRVVAVRRLEIDGKADGIEIWVEQPIDRFAGYTGRVECL